MGSSGLNAWTTRGDVRSFFVLSKSSWCLSVHTQAEVFFRRERSDTMWCARSGTKPASCCTRPEKERMSWMFLGIGKSLMARTISSSGEILPPLSIWKPANATLLPHLSFLLLMVMPVSLHLRKTFLAAWYSRSQSSPPRRMSSMILDASSTSMMMMSDLMFHSSDVLQRPIGPRHWRKVPPGRRKVVRCLDSSARST